MPDSGEDLFPRSFIVSLPTPSNYVGPATIFGDESRENETGESDRLPVIRDVTDHADSVESGERCGWVPPRHNKYHIPLHDGVDEVPPSLRKAIFSFVLVCAARRARGQRTVHNSMLIHVTRFTAVQERVREQVRSEVIGLQRRLRYGDGDSSEQIREQLRSLWEKDFVPTTASIVSRGLMDSTAQQTWEAFASHLEWAATSIDVREINGRAGEVCPMDASPSACQCLVVATSTGAANPT